jgi:hypothetical protein
MSVKAIPTIPLDATSSAPISAPTRPPLANEITIDDLYRMTARWVLEEDTSDIRDWMRRLRVWVRAEVVGRPR